VLHHLGDPIAGWRVLVDKLAPAGLMQISLYSKSGRAPLSAMREEAERRGLEPVSADIKSLRPLVMSGGLTEELTEILPGSDFYSQSNFRDLVFPAQEHQFTPGEIGEALESLNLNLIGFDLSKLLIPRHAIERFSAHNGVFDIDACERIEQLYPRAFSSMYRFWCQKG
jgi:hypothetical protein